MKTIDIQDAQARLDDLIDRAVAGEDIVITRAGKPLVRMSRIHRRLGFLKGEIKVPDDFDREIDTRVAARDAATTAGEDAGAPHDKASAPHDEARSTRYD